MRKISLLDELGASLTYNMAAKEKQWRDTAHIEYSAFDEQMVFVLKQTSWYGSEEKAEALRIMQEADGYENLGD